MSTLLARARAFFTPFVIALTLLFVGLGVVVCLLQDAIDTNSDLIAKVATQQQQLEDQQVAIEVEGRERRDQSCEISEREHKVKVRSLRQTYKYLDDLSPEEIETTLNQTILRNLPQTERDARIDVAPDFCDEPGIGRKEPDPELPRQRDFSHLLTEPPTSSGP